MADNNINWKSAGSNGPGIISIAFGIAFAWGLIEFFKTGSAAAILFFAKWWVITIVALFGTVLGILVVIAILAIIYKLATGSSNGDALSAEDLADDE